MHHNIFFNGRKLETAKVTKYASDFFFLMYGSLYGRILGSHEQTDIKN